MYTFSTQLVRNALFDRDDCIRPTPAPDKAKQAAKGGFAVAKKDLPVVAMVTEAEPDVNHLLTDYLIVGAGAMGLGFLDELINSSTDMEAIIVDTRSALEYDGGGDGDGGHKEWWPPGLPLAATGTTPTTLSVSTSPPSPME